MKKHFISILAVLLFVGGVVYAQTPGGSTVPMGGTGNTFYSEGAILVGGSSTLRLSATTSPTVGAITATSTAQPSRFQSIIISGTCTGCTLDGTFSTSSALYWLQSTTSPLTVSWLNATSTTATSTFSGGVSIGKSLIVTGNISTSQLTASSLTSGRVPYSSTGGLLTDSSNLTYNGTTLTANALTVSGTGTSTSITNNLSVGGNLFVGGFADMAVNFVEGHVISGYFTATTTTASTFPNASITQLSNLTSNGLIYTAGGVGTLNVTSTSTLNIGGNAGTATALASDPSDCGANTWAISIVANGNLTCSAVTYAGITAMSSANFFGLITDETGVGGVVVGSASPTLTGLTTMTYASTTMLTSSQGATFATVSGNVGIGTTTPKTLLHITQVNSDANRMLTVEAKPGSSYGPEIMLMNDDGVSGQRNYGLFSEGSFEVRGYNDAISSSQTLAYMKTSSHLYLTPHNAPGDFYMAATGNIGMGTQSPAAFLNLSSSTASTMFRVDDGGDGDTTPFLIDAIGNVGIGTTSPGALFTVDKSSSFPAALFAGTSNQLRIMDKDDGKYWDIDSDQTKLNFAYVGLANTLTLSGSNVGIGTTSPGALFAIGNGVQSGGVYVNSNGNVGIGVVDPNRRLMINSGAVEGIRVNANTGTNAINIGDGIFSIDAPGVSNGRFIVNDAGNVGIGTTAPGTLLHVYGAQPSGQIDQLRVEGTADASLTIKSAATTNYSYLTFNQGATKQFEVGVTASGDAAGGDLFYINSTPQAGSAGADLVITNDGNVGIGTTSPTQMLSVSSTGGNSAYFAGNVGIGMNNPVYALDVAGTVRVTNGLQTAMTLVGNTGNASGFELSFGSVSAGSIGTGNVTLGGMIFSDLGIRAGNNLYLGTGNSSSNNIRLTVRNDSGYVGVGTTSPYSKLSVWGSGTGTGQLFSAVNNASTTVFQILDNGNVGIGTTSPGSLLSIGASGTGINFFDGTSATSTISGNLYVKGTLRATNSYVGDLIFANDVRLTERGSQIYIVYPDGSEYPLNGSDYKIVPIRSQEENWQWIAIGILGLMVIALYFKKK